MRACWFSFGLGFRVFFLPRASLRVSCVFTFFVFYLCSELSVPVQVITDCLKWPVMCWVGRKTLLRLPTQLAVCCCVQEDVSVAEPAAEPVATVTQPEPVVTTIQADNTASASVNVGGPSVSATNSAAAGASTQPVTVGGIEFAASAKEARMRMRKKGDVRQQGANLSLRDKYDLLQNLWNTHTTKDIVIISVLDGKSLCQQCDHVRSCDNR